MLYVALHVCVACMCCMYIALHVCVACMCCIACVCCMRAHMCTDVCVLHVHAHAMLHRGTTKHGEVTEIRPVGHLYMLCYDKDETYLHYNHHTLHHKVRTIFEVALSHFHVGKWEEMQTTLRIPFECSNLLTLYNHVVSKSQPVIHLRERLIPNSIKQQP